jgi:hypothetical protein
VLPSTLRSDDEEVHNIRDGDKARSIAMMALFSAHRWYKKQQSAGSFAGYAYKTIYYALTNLYRKIRQMAVIA